MYKEKYSQEKKVSYKNIYINKLRKKKEILTNNDE